MDILHHCDNPPCYEARHLFTGTDLDNVKDKISKGRAFVFQRVVGEETTAAKLTAEEVIGIRNIYVKGTISMREIAERFSVCTSNVEHILSRRRWKHL